MVAVVLSVKAEAVAVDRASCGCGEGWVGRSVGAAGVACRYRQGGLADGQGAVDVDHCVVRQVRASRHRDDRIGSNRRARWLRSCSR